MAARAGSAGFTLLEVLVAMAVLGVLLAGLTADGRLVLAAWGRQDAVLERGDALRSAASSLRRLVEAMDPVGTPPLLVAGPERLAFVAVLPDWGQDAAQRPGRQRLDVAIVLDGTGRLLVRWARHRHVRGGAPAVPRDEVLLRDVGSIRFDYWDGGWQPAVSGERLPRLVRLRIGFRPGDPRRLPPIVVAPRRDPPT